MRSMFGFLQRGRKETTYSDMNRYIHLSKRLRDLKFPMDSTLFITNYCYKLFESDFSRSEI
jgi:hypothetical protein